MDNRRIEVPDNKNYEYALDQAYKLVCEKLLNIENLERHCDISDSKFIDKDGTKIIRIRYLDEEYSIALPVMDVSKENEKDEVPFREKILLLHYLAQAKGTPPSGKYITFRELPEGPVYFRTFSKRTIQPLVEHFGKEPDRLVEIGKDFGGVTSDLGDTSIVIPAFSRVPVTIVLWKSDDEFPPEGSVIFDGNIQDYLTTEDVTVMSEIITWKLVRKLFQK
ncbi:MAG: DUF3786 domain-containing protein [Dehalococcoidales bacterium]|nr:MAG: DUF3786 domain-containing protein [Dehalococcoidales bacterium]